MLIRSFPAYKAKRVAALLLFLASFAVVCVSAQPGDTANTKGEIEAIKREISEIKNNQNNRTKDIWDKLGTVSTLVSGLLVTVIGLYATQKYAERQREKEARNKDREIQIQQVEIVEKFFPYLMSGDETKKGAALQALAAIGNENLALKLAKIFESHSQDENSTASDSVISPIHQVTESEKIISLLKRSVVLITSWDGGVGVGFFCAKWGLILTLDYVVRDMPKALINVTRADGKKADAQVWLIDTEQGVALLSTRFDDETTPLWSESSSPLPGTAVFTIGHSSAEETFISLSGLVSKYQVLEPGRICVDLGFLRVMGGAPVLTDKGQLVGVVSEYNNETKQAILIPASVIDNAFVEQRKDPELWEERRKEEYMLRGHRV